MCQFFIKRGFEIEEDWDEGVHLLLFATREAIQQYSALSPFDPVFGHTVRGPLKLLKKNFKYHLAVLSVNLLKYFSDFALSFFRACEFAKAYLRFDRRNLRKRSMMSMLKNVTFSQVKRFLRYYQSLVTQLCHINMLKPYVEMSNNIVKEPANVNVLVFETRKFRPGSNAVLQPRRIEFNDRPTLIS